MYISSSATTIAMVLAQDNLHGQDHVIYYVGKNLIDSKTRYSHVEKLALAMVIVVQKFHYYILLLTTIVLVDQNPMHYTLTCEALGASIPVGSLSYRNLTLSSLMPIQISPWFSWS